MVVSHNLHSSETKHSPAITWVISTAVFITFIHQLLLSHFRHSYPSADISQHSESRSDHYKCVVLDNTHLLQTSNNNLVPYTL